MICTKTLETCALAADSTLNARALTLPGMTDINPRIKFGMSVLGAGGICLTFTLDHSDFVIPIEYIGYAYAGSVALLLIGLYLIVTGGFDWRQWINLPASRISLRVAGQKAYDELYDTVFGKFIRKLHKDNPIGYYLHALTGRTAAYGLDLHGTKKVLIEGLGNGSGNFKDGGDKWGGIGQNDITHKSIEIERKALEDYIKEKKSVKKVGLGEA